jgi:VCBS repeat-containing protein
VDSPATFNPASAAGTYGSFSIAANGTWTYTLSNAAANVQALREGDTRTETFTVTTADGTPRSIIVTVLGTNEIPTVANVLASGAEDPAPPSRSPSPAPMWMAPSPASPWPICPPTAPCTGMPP